MKEAVSAVNLQKVVGKRKEEVQDLVVKEVPLEIRIKFFNGIEFVEKRLVVTMRTPGNDFELAAGFLLTEGIIYSHSDIDKIFYCEEIKSKEEEGNVLIVVLQKSLEISDSIFNRNFYVNSSCGVCSKSSIESIHTLSKNELKKDFIVVPYEIIHSIPVHSIHQQDVFKHTGGLHASVLLDSIGKALITREDIGRHNALDKLIGALISLKIDVSDKILFVSGRAGFELVQKCIVIGIPIMISVGAPSSLAVDLAKEYGLTLIGFANGEKFNVYSGSQRLSV